MARTKTMKILTPKRSGWAEFTERLEGPEGCNFHKDKKGKTRWKCAGSMNQDLARAILSTMPNLDVEGTLDWCREQGGHCDCEILFNCE